MHTHGQDSRFQVVGAAGPTVPLPLSAVREALQSLIDRIDQGRVEYHGGDGGGYQHYDIEIDRAADLDISTQGRRASVRIAS